ncbi:hypothetical protein RND81_07G083200 [Saponaria officinalis]|uniref:SCP domain-containing protein n=1 Tax=Saponaria officinalis TaxID=3572 RepID=A0AAW1JT34_SAPOF
MSPFNLCFSLLSLILISSSNALKTRGYTPTTRYTNPLLAQHPPLTHPTTHITQYLKGQNTARAAIGLPLLAWDQKLAGYAQWWANQRRGDCALKHSNGPYGENIFWGSYAGYTPEFAVQNWVIERKWYNYYSNSCGYGEDCGHYTQIVWRNTRRVGCAKMSSDEEVEQSEEGDSQIQC